MVSKVKTFEEWLDSKSGDWRENMPTAIYYILLDSWQDAHENAAMVAADLYLGGGNDYLHGYGDALDRAASAIREAAK